MIDLFNSVNQYLPPFIYVGTTIAPIIQRIPISSNEELEKSIKNQFKDLIHKTNIRKDVQFRVIKNPTFCAARGVNFCKLGNPHVLLAPKLNEVDEEAFSFIVKHELSHIKHNDLFTIPAIGLATYLVLRFFMNEKISKSLVVNYLTYLLPVIPSILFSRYRERKADEYAISHSSNEELEGALRFFKAARWIDSLPSFFDPFHPSLTQRMNQIKNALIQRDHPLPKTDYTSEGYKKLNKLITLMSE